MIDLTVSHEGLVRAAKCAAEHHVLLPTFAQMKDPHSVPASITEGLGGVGLWEVAPRNLFRIHWHNEPSPNGGGFAGVNTMEFPDSLTGVQARIIALVGRWFPTGSHKVGAAYGCLASRLVTGQFDPTAQKAVWPSTGNYCRGGAFDSALLGCKCVTVLPEQMSRERFEWLSGIAGEVIVTPGGESNVKEILDKCHELRRTRPDIVVFNQFEEFGNYLWHFSVTGSAMLEVLEHTMGAKDSFRGLVLATGSAGTLGAGDHLKQVFPRAKTAACEAVQCPTLMANGYGSHRIEGIGDKHVPWIHNVGNTDMVIGLDDAGVLRLCRLFNEPAGRSFLAARGVADHVVERLGLLGLSGIANLMGAIKFSRYYDLGPNDLVLTVLTDSMELYQSRLAEMHIREGGYTERDAVADYALHIQGLAKDHLLELTQADRRRIHNLKYYTWVEQQGRSQEELDAQWCDPEYWTRIQKQVRELDALILEFNARARTS